MLRNELSLNSKCLNKIMNIIMQKQNLINKKLKKRHERNLLKKEEINLNLLF